MWKTILILSTLLVAGVFWLVTRPAVPKPYVQSYHDALKRIPGSAASTERGIESFREAFRDLSDPGFADRVERLYADPLYFNDTLHTVTSRQELVRYMAATSNSLASSSVRVDQIMQSEADVWIRWTMNFESAAGSTIHSESIGMSHLRFDEDGRIVLHQDFWDAASGLYRNLPVIGYVLDQADRRLPK